MKIIIYWPIYFQSLLYHCFHVMLSHLNIHACFGLAFAFSSMLHQYSFLYCFVFSLLKSKDAVERRSWLYMWFVKSDFPVYGVVKYFWCILSVGKFFYSFVLRISVFIIFYFTFGLKKKKYSYNYTGGLFRYSLFVIGHFCGALKKRLFIKLILVFVILCSYKVLSMHLCRNH